VVLFLIPRLVTHYNLLYTELETLLKSDLEYKGSFAFSHTYSDAPNPLLTLSDLGNFGLPLSPRDAQLVKNRCIHAPFGKGERTVVDTEVRDTWEMDAKDVIFRNVEWQAWMAGVVGEVCQTLGVNAAASRPRAELYKLLLYLQARGDFQSRYRCLGVVYSSSLCPAYFRFFCG
jgi:hypothetical protein